MRQICHTVVTAEEGSFPPPVPRFFPAPGGAQSGPREWYNSNLPLGTPPLGVPRHMPPEGKKSDTSESPPENGGGGSCAGPLIPPHATPAG